jgi:hypothetical protein
MKSTYLFLTIALLVLLCSAGFSQKGKQRGKPATPAETTNTSPSPTPPPEKVLSEIKETIERYNAGDEAGAYEKTFNFAYTKCDTDCNDCTLTWSFITYEETKDPTVARASETSTVEVKLKSIDQELVFVEEDSKVRFGTNDGPTVKVTIKAPSLRVGRLENGQRKPTSADIPEQTNSWRIELRDKEGAKAVKTLLEQVLKQSCAKH